jgi:hypothetical protein
MGGTVLFESGLDLAQGIGSDSRSDTIVFFDNDLLLLSSLGVDDLGLQAEKALV